LLPATLFAHERVTIGEDRLAAVGAAESDRRIASGPGAALPGRELHEQVTSAISRG